MAVDFIRQCTRRNPRERPTARELLVHPWITLTCASIAFSDDTADEADDDVEGVPSHELGFGGARHPLHAEFSEADGPPSPAGSPAADSSSADIGEAEATLRDVDVAFGVTEGPARDSSDPIMSSN
jgi:serine/threonine protein kinase